MDEAWELAVQRALKSQNPPLSLNLDVAVKPQFLNGKLPSASIFERRPTLEHLSLGGLRISSLENFPKLPKLQSLVLTDNRITGGLGALVNAGLGELTALDLSNNRIEELKELEPLKELKILTLDLFQCPVTKVKDYRKRVFEMIGSLKYLDDFDAKGNVQPESDDEESEEGEEDGEDEDEEGEEDDDDDEEDEEEEGDDDESEEVSDEEDGEGDGDENNEVNGSESAHAKLENGSNGSHQPNKRKRDPES